MKTIALGNATRHRAACAALFCFLVTTPGRAESKARPVRAPLAAKGGDAAKKQRAQQHLKTGTEAFENGDYPLAVSELEASYAEVPDPAIQYALGQAHRLNGDCTKAAVAYRAFLQSNPPEKQRDAATSNLERCEETNAAAAAAVPAEPQTAPTSEAAPPPSAKVSDPPSTPPEPDTSHPWYTDVAGDVLVGSGIVAGAVGTVVFLSGRGKVSDADSARDEGTWQSNRDAADSGLSQQRIGLVVMGVGGALIVGGVVRYATMGGKRVETGSLGIGPTLGGVLATGTF